MDPSQQSIPVNGGIKRLLWARQSGFGTSALHRIKHLLKNVSHPKHGDFRGLWEIEVSSSRGEIPSPKESKAQDTSSCWKSRGPLVPESLSIRQHKVRPNEQFWTNLLTVSQIYSQNNYIIQVTGGIKNRCRANGMAVQNRKRALTSDIIGQVFMKEIEKFDQGLKG